MGTTHLLFHNQGRGRPIGGGSSEISFPLDGYVGVRVAFSVRRLLTTYEGSLIRLRRQSDDAELDFGFDSNGDLDVAVIVAWLGGSNGWVVTWYDQSGNGYNATQAVAATQPQYIANGINSKPVIRNNPAGNFDKLVFPDEVFRNLSAGTMFSVGELHTHTGGNNAMAGGLFDTTNAEYGMYLAVRDSDGKIMFFFGNANENRSSTVFVTTDPHIYVGKGANGVLSSVYVDGIEVAYEGARHVIGTTTIAGFIRDGAIGQTDSVGEGNDADADYAEYIVVDSALLDGTRSALESNQSSYYNI